MVLPIMKPDRLEVVESFKSWLDRHNLTIYQFALNNGIDPNNLRRIVNGQQTRVSLEAAARIEKGTNGTIPMDAWVLKGTGT